MTEITDMPAPSGSEESDVTRDAYWRAGYDDGRVGQTWIEHRRILQAEAEQQKTQQQAELQKKLAISKAELEIAEDELERERGTYDKLAEALREATQDRDRYPSQYSRVIGSLFIVSALAIMAADFPLSRAISREILQDTSAVAWMSNTSLVAYGIVAMGLFFKILADPFTRPRYLLPRYLRPISGTMTAVLALILALVIAIAFSTLAIFRAETVVSSNEDISAQNATSPTVPSPVAGPTTDGSAVSKLRRIFDALDIDFVSKVAFLALGLVLPILSGIFLSTGSSRLHNYAQVRRLEKNYPDRRSTFDAALRQWHEKTATITWMQDELTGLMTRPTSANSRFHEYLHGYERGLCSPGTTSAGIAQEVLGFFQRWLVAARQHENTIRTETVAHNFADAPDVSSAHARKGAEAS